MAEQENKKGYAVNEYRISKAPSSLLELFKMQVRLWEHIG